MLVRLTMALRYLYARIAALRVLGPSSAWFLAAVARMSRASSSGDLVGSVLVVLGTEASTSQTRASLVLGRLAGRMHLPREVDAWQRRNFLFRASLCQDVSRACIVQTRWQTFM